MIALREGNPAFHKKKHDGQALLCGGWRRERLPCGYRHQRDCRTSEEEDQGEGELWRGETPDTIKVLMKERMVETRKLENRAYLGAGFTRVDDDIHILVELPAEPDEVAKYNRWIVWLFAGQCVLVAAAVVLSAVVVWYGQSLADQERCLASTVPRFVCDCIGIITITGLLVGLLKLLIAHIESKLRFGKHWWRRLSRQTIILINQVLEQNLKVTYLGYCVPFEEDSDEALVAKFHGSQVARLRTLPPSANRLTFLGVIRLWKLRRDLLLRVSRSPSMCLNTRGNPSVAQSSAWKTGALALSPPLPGWISLVQQRKRALIPSNDKRFHSLCCFSQLA